MESKSGKFSIKTLYPVLEPGGSISFLISVFGAPDMLCMLFCVTWTWVKPSKYTCQHTVAKLG